MHSICVVNTYECFRFALLVRAMRAYGLWIVDARLMNNDGKPSDIFDEKNKIE